MCLLACLSWHENVFVGEPVWLTMKNVCVRCLRLSLKFVCLLACLSLHENVLVGGPVWLTRKNVCSTGSLLIWVGMKVGVGLS